MQVADLQSPTDNTISCVRGRTVEFEYYMNVEELISLKGRRLPKGIASDLLWPRFWHDELRVLRIYRGVASEILDTSSADCG